MTKDEGYGLRTFTDTNGREWSILLTGPVFEEIEEKIGIDISDETGHGLLMALKAKPYNLGRILWIALAKQLKEKGVTPEHFGEALASGEVTQEAVRALKAALVFFTQPKARESLTAALQTQEELDHDAHGVVTSKIRDPATRAALLKAVEDRMTKTLNQITNQTTTSPPSANDSPDTAE
jgi:hypothetical protein